MTPVAFAGVPGFIGRGRHRRDALNVKRVDGSSRRRWRGRRLRALVDAQSGSSAGTSTQQDASVFQRWAEERGFNVSGVSISLFEDGLRGQSATGDAKLGATLLSAPPAYSLQTTTLEGGRSPIASVGDGVWRKLPWYGRLALKLHYARQQADWGAWAALLPARVDTPLHWDDAEVAELQVPQMIDAVGRQRTRYRELHAALGSAGVTYADFEWALEAVQSRAFEGELEAAPWRERRRLMAFVGANALLWPALGALPWGASLNGALTALLALVAYDALSPRALRALRGVSLRRYVLAPGVDFFNHTAAPNAAVAYEYFDERLVVRATRGVARGEQLYISYGAKDSARLLLFHGFLLEDNPADAYHFGAAAEQLLGVPRGALRLERDGTFSASARRAVSKSLSGGEAEIAQVLRELCAAELDGLPTSVEDDERLLADGALSARRRLAVRYRLAMKRILRAGAGGASG